MKTQLLSLAAAILGLCTALPAAAQFQKPQDAVEYRQSAMTLMSAHLGRIGAMTNGRAPYDAAAAQANADLLVVLSKLPYVAFIDGTPGKKKGEASPDIWKNRAKFDSAATKTQEELVKLATAAKAGNLDALKSAFGPAASSCKACHDDFRVD